LRRVLSLFLLALAVALVPSCSSYSSPPPGTTHRGLVLVSQDVNALNLFAGLIIIDSLTDVRPVIAPISAGATPGQMVVTPNRTLTLAFSSFENQLSIISNLAQANAAHVTLPGGTESIVAAPDNQTAYAAVPTAPVLGQSPGAVEVISLNAAAISDQAEVPGVRYIALSNGGNRILAFSDNSDSVTVITPSNIGTGVDPVTVPGFNRPVGAYFSSDDNTAYVLNCGPECVGGTQASVQLLDLTRNPPLPGQVIPLPAATVFTVVGTTMYVAGTPYTNGANPQASQPCTGQTTAATTCGVLSIIDLTSLTVTNPSPIVITDGFHNRLSMASNGQLFIGARKCTEIIPPIPTPPGAEIRGCLSIYNSQTGAVVIPSNSGDATGFQPIATRTVVYVIQGGELTIYDTTTDKPQSTQIDLSGEAIDVKSIDF
jgi:hypothetical protein